MDIVRSAESIGSLGPYLVLRQHQNVVEQEAWRRRTVTDPEYHAVEHLFMI